MEELDLRAAPRAASPKRHSPPRVAPECGEWGARRSPRSQIRFERDGHAAWTWHMRGDQSPVTGWTGGSDGTRDRSVCAQLLGRVAVSCVWLWSAPLARALGGHVGSRSRARGTEKLILLMAHGVHGRRRARDQRALTQYHYGCKKSYGNGWSGDAVWRSRPRPGPSFRPHFASAPAHLFFFTRCTSYRRAQRLYNAHR